MRVHARAALLLVLAQLAARATAQGSGATCEAVDVQTRTSEFQQECCDEPYDDVSLPT
eukprot:SAG11_NODE_21800_length_418_cov_1.294671_1_plen_57_part_01